MARTPATSRTCSPSRGFGSAWLSRARCAGVPEPPGHASTTTRAPAIGSSVASTSATGSTGSCCAPSPHGSRRSGSISTGLEACERGSRALASHLMARRSALRASDHDRERVADRLRHATGEGRLLADELEERLGTVFSARTYGELDAVVSDLPTPRDPRRSKTPTWVKATLALAIVMAVIAVLAVVALVVIGLARAWLLWVLVVWACFG